MKIRTVTVNDRGQIVIPEDIRKDCGITKETTLVIIEKEGEIVLKKESLVLETLQGEDDVWRTLSRESMKRAWSKEDEIWGEVYKNKRRQRKCI